MDQALPGGVAVKLTVREAAAVLHVAETELYRWVDDEDVPFVMIHQRPRFDRLELLEWAIERGLPIGVDLYEGDRDQPFTSALERGGPPIEVTSVRDLIAELSLERERDRDTIRAVLEARFGALLVHARDAIAIPLARSPIICPDTRSAVMLRWCEPALAVGDASVRAVFLIIAPTIKQHLQLLSRLSLALHDRELATAIAARSDFPALLAEARRWELAVDGSVSPAGAGAAS